MNWEVWTMKSRISCCNAGLLRRTLLRGAPLWGLWTLGGLLLLPLPVLLRFGSAQEWRMLIYGLLVVLVITFRPSGLMGNKELTLQNLKKFLAGFFLKNRGQAPDGKGDSV